MRHGSILAVVLALSGTLAYAAYAGQKSTFEVKLNLTKRTASGAMGSARNSGDYHQNIGCGMRADAQSLLGVCSVNAENLLAAECRTNDPNMLAAIGAITSDSYLAFTWDAAFNCTSIQVETYSQFAPKGP